MDAVGKLLGLGKVGQLALHPDGVAVRGVGDGPVDGAVAAALEAVVPFPRPRRVPVEEDLLAAEQALGQGPGLGVALALGLGAVPGGEVGVGAEGGGDGVVEALEVGGGEPLVLDGLELRARLAGLLGGEEELAEGAEGGVGAAEDEGVVAGVDGGGDEGGGLGVCAGDGQEVGACFSIG